MPRGPELVGHAAERRNPRPLRRSRGVCPLGARGKLGCTDCHTDITEVPHASKPFTTRRDFTIAYYEACKRCHFANYSKTLDSVHYASIARGDRMAPTCVDCHGAHDITRPNEPRSRISQTCATCHAGVSATYAKSVHGRALDREPERRRADVHRLPPLARHRRPARRGLAAEEPGTLRQLPRRTRRMMRKYGLSTNVMETYLRRLPRR